jgi:hypothetical protein
VSVPVLQLRVPETTLARLDDARSEETRSARVLRLIDRELTGQTAMPSPASPSLAALPDGEPGNGALCMGPGCFQRDTSKYGSRSAPPAAQPSKAAPTSETCPSAARLMHRGAA